MTRFCIKFSKLELVTFADALVRVSNHFVEHRGTILDAAVFSAQVLFEPELILRPCYFCTSLAFFVLFAVHRELIRTHFDALLCRRDEVRMVVRTFIYVAVGVHLFALARDELDFRHKAFTVVLGYALFEIYL